MTGTRGRESQGRLELVRGMSQKYQSDRLHGEHVAELADVLYEALLPLHGLDADYRELLAHAAILHDIGYFLAARAHHRHSAYLVAADETLASYPKEQRDFLRRTVRNHRRRVRPGPRHWSRCRREALLWLSGILRVADVLDYDHQQRARITGVRSSAGGFEVVVQGLDPALLGDRLRRKAELLRDMVGGTVRFLKEPK